MIRVWNTIITYKTEYSRKRNKPSQKTWSKISLKLYSTSLGRIRSSGWTYWTSSAFNSLSLWKNMKDWRGIFIRFQSSDICGFPKAILIIRLSEYFRTNICVSIVFKEYSILECKIIMSIWSIGSDCFNPSKILTSSPVLRQPELFSR